MATSMDTLGCYIFLDNSNIWIEGQKLQAKELVDDDEVNADVRFRIDYGRLLNVLGDKRRVLKSFLFGSEPPKADSVWLAATKCNFNVTTHWRSGGGQEKEVDTDMATEIVDTLHVDVLKESPENSIFIIVTGDRDLIPPINKVLSNKVRVELWSWKQSLASCFQELAKRNHLFKVKEFDSHKDNFSFMSYRKQDTYFESKNMLVYKAVDDEDVDSVVDHARQTNRFFMYKITGQDMFFCFPHSKLANVLEHLKRLPQISYKPCCYDDYDWTLVQRAKRPKIAKTLKPRRKGKGYN